MNESTTDLATRVRGIYTTALTAHLLENDIEVVQASQPIQQRFDRSFSVKPADVMVETTAGRQGVIIHGSSVSAQRVRNACIDIGIDTLSWQHSLPVGLIGEASVKSIEGADAVCSLQNTEAALRLENIDRYIEPGDSFTVQVRSSPPPWEDSRPRIQTGIQVENGILSAIRNKTGVTVDAPDSEATRELVGMTDLLSVDVLDGWGLRWDAQATECDLDTLQTAVQRVNERAAAIEASLDKTAPINDELCTYSIWFGRESRSALDRVRGKVTSTMVGHHRTKAVSARASAGVDLAEALCDPDPNDTFPFAAVTQQFGPAEGDQVDLMHGKPDGRAFSLGRGEVTDWEAEGSLEITRQMSGGGHYDALGTPRKDGDTAVTKIREGRWWYPTVYRSQEGHHKGTYLNICTPVECFPSAVRYVDLHIDVIKHPDGSVTTVDEDELQMSVDDGDIPPELAERARSVARSVNRALSD